MSHKHLFNKNLPRTNGMVWGYACEYCHALITEDGVIHESEESGCGMLAVITCLLIVFAYAVIRGLGA